ncbi:hypothetical protein GCM10011348_12330 [Marinobacterium nitratireducens]|uniref:Uncharacterized protein n=1 Tax=Marinobacterium nitratireducens TaxID=518897 RepID=A0A918DQR2_9GAMM|nr:hypothetical protein GCM10011348_12330 [Marinobacterium nitratireducens]
MLLNASRVITRDGGTEVAQGTVLFVGAAPRGEAVWRRAGFIRGGEVPVGLGTPLPRGTNIVGVAPRDEAFTAAAPPDALNDAVLSCAPEAGGGQEAPGSTGDLTIRWIPTRRRRRFPN